MATRRSRSDSTDAAIDAMKAAASPLPDIPKHVLLSPAHLPFWDAILRARMREEWTDVDLVVAAQLARCQFDIERETLMLDMEGSVVKNDRNTQICNPRVTVLEQLARREMALMRCLQLGGTATGNRKPDLVKGRKLQQQAETARREVEDDDLLAR